MAPVCRKHIRFHPEVGHVVTEYLPDVPWAGEFNTIVGIAGHHIYEGRWLRNSTFMDDYSRFWVSPYALPLEYTEWLADAVFARCVLGGVCSLSQSNATWPGNNIS